MRKSLGVLVLVTLPMLAAAVPTPAQLALGRWYDASRIGNTFNVPPPHGAVFDGVHVWTVSHDDATGTGILTKLRTSDGAVVQTVTGLTAFPTAVTFDGKSIWIAHFNDAVTRVSAADGTVTGSYALAPGSTPWDILFDGTFVWTANMNGGTLTRINPVNGTFSNFPMGTGPVALAFDGANLWVSMTSTSSGWVQHVRPSDGAILSDGITIAGSRNSGGLAYDGKALYVASSWSNFITRIDLSTRGKTSINVGATLPGYGGSGPWGILFDGTYVWVANQGASTVQRLGISSNGTVTSNITIPTAGSIRNFVFDGAAVWGWGPGNSSGNIYSWQTSPLLTKF